MTRNAVYCANRSQRWTDEDDLLIIENRGKLTAEEMARRLNRSPGAVRMHAQKLIREYQLKKYVRPIRVPHTFSTEDEAVRTAVAWLVGKQEFRPGKQRRVRRVAWDGGEIIVTFVRGNEECSDT
jgi:hypothetical protein